MSSPSASDTSASPKWGKPPLFILHSISKSWLPRQGEKAAKEFPILLSSFDKPILLSKTKSLTCFSIDIAFFEGRGPADGVPLS